jgi:hypothetical protein
MTLWQGFAVLCVLALLAFAIYAQTQRLKLPVSFTSLDELSAVAGVAKWARQRFDRGDPRRTAIDQTWWYLARFDFTRMGARISAQEIALLAPFIDQVIAGEGPPPFLSAEYGDDRPALLGAFKARMQTEGRWPRDTTASRAPTDA